MKITEDLTRSQIIGTKLECIRLAVKCPTKNKSDLNLAQEWYGWIMKKDENPPK